MGARHPDIDAYIEKSADFARPILRHLRERVHEACPDVEEAIKWNFPNFLYQGMMCNMAAFKAHCTFGFWLGDLVVGEGASAREGMGQLGKIASLEDLPPDDVLEGWIRTAMELNEKGVKPPRKPKKKAPPKVPDDLVQALDADPDAKATFQGFSPSHQREYVEWITEARRDATRAKRIAQAVEWLAEGKPRNWKYMA